MRNAGIVVGSDATLVGLGDVRSGPVILAFVGLVVIATLDARKMAGAILVGILAVTAVGLVSGDASFAGVLSSIPSIEPAIGQLDIAGAFAVAFLCVFVSFLFTDVSGTSSILIAIGREADLPDRTGRLPRLRQALVVDSGASLLGSVLGTWGPEDEPV